MNIPKSFIQIHYHNRPSGVTKVMYEYARIFADISHSPTVKNYILCHRRQNDNDSYTTNKNIISIPDCDYHAFRSKKSFTTVCKKLVRQLDPFLSNPSMPRPICVVGHNLALGKNIALSKAFSILSMRYQNDKTIRFFSVIHDLVEEGRFTLLQNIYTIVASGVCIWNHLYPHTNVQFVVLNKRNYTLFKQAGYSVSHLPNPIHFREERSPLTKNEYKSITCALTKVSKEDKTSFDPAKKTIFYPVRVISRKNILEAIILSCIVYKTNIIIGGYGTSQQDKKLFNRILHYSQKYNLPVILNVERITRYIHPTLVQKGTIFDLLYLYADICITTSISEGFGYTLYEPWLYGKKVIGRLPHGISHFEIAHFDHLYTRFNIPTSWISIDTVKKKYYFTLKQFLGGNNVFLDPNHFSDNFQKSFIHHNYFDFGALTQEMQFLIFNTVCMDQDITEIKLTIGNTIRSLSKGYSLHPSHSDLMLINKNSVCIRSILVNKSFYKDFMRCFFTVYSFTDKSTNGNQLFLNHFFNLDNFRIISSTCYKT